MIKTILVAAAASEADPAGYAAAFAIARLFAAHVDALHVRLNPVEVAVAMSTEAPAVRCSKASSTACSATPISAKR